MPVSKNSKKSSAKKVKTVVEPKVEPKVVEKVVEDIPVENEVSDTPYAEEFLAVAGELDEVMNTVRSLKTRLQKLEKLVHREHKANMKKIRGKRRRVQDPANPSGFAKPGPVSTELRKFLGLAKDELIARTAVTKRINDYCKEHNLQNEADKRKIHPDAALKKLLKMGPKDELTFFNLQTYMKVHFPNKEGVYPTA